ncbi:MAG: bifunctional phosphopantothenoylcysteine decarboxylase/phosphopantothenate--cysteine ligase CoaBC [Bacteroidetes bacterium]|jgi:phosphopantothenoylcysteine decarboxylase/phosphopantothenate--cysteine ligase|nr:bifunctional phosphopantothenoylcysteine decarboxylase/phosphopantothenate--cysteine ligase CoaBC [Bacteroidota bacterium]
MFAGKRIILGVTGGIAAYKAVYLLREFQKAGAEVRVTMTPSATRFVGTETFAALSQNPVAVEVFNDEDPGEDWTKHIHWGDWADLFIIAPCTANTLSKIVQGQSDNMLTSTVLAARCPLLICPTMDGEMYESPAVSENVNKAKSHGYYILEPEEGYLASGMESKGRLPEPKTILEESQRIIKKHRIQGPLTGKRVVVSAGPTREFMDPIRFISNPSSGKMGLAMAEAARLLGADVTLLHGPISIEIPDRIPSKEFVSADELFNLIKEDANADVIIMAAAVSDFKPSNFQEQKVKKAQADTTLKLRRNPDILEWLGNQKNEGQVLIGFAMETENVMENAQKKLKQKNLDWICANELNRENSAFGSDENSILLLNDDFGESFSGTKREIAKDILAKIFE